MAAAAASSFTPNFHAGAEAEAIAIATYNVGASTNNWGTKGAPAGSEFGKAFDRLADDLRAVARRVDVVFLTEIGGFGRPACQERVLRGIGEKLKDNPPSEGWQIMGGVGPFAIMHNSRVGIEARV